MNGKFSVVLLVASVALSACGGGGNASPAAAPTASTPTAPAAPAAPPATPATPADTSPQASSPAQPAPADNNPAPPAPPAGSPMANALDPYSGQPASGTATTSISGMVVNDITAGATVTAYAVQPDGSNGAQIGVSAVTGADGKFSIQLTSAASGMVRLVATNGSFKSEADGSTQANKAIELVAPYVTSDLNFFVITPATHIVSHLVSYKAKKGSTLADAYVYGFGQFLNMTAPNVLLPRDERSGINLLKTVPASADDKLRTYQDLLDSIEWFGVRYDLPSSVVVRVLAAHAENNSPLAGVDGSGAAINVGKWVNGQFDETQPVSLDEITALHNADGTIQKSATGQILHDFVEGVIGNRINDIYTYNACKDSAALPAAVQRYPNLANVFSDPNTNAGTCHFTIQRVDDLKAKIVTNNRNK